MNTTRSGLGPAKAQQLYLVLQDQIARGELGVGDRLPSEPALAAVHQVSRVTVRRALRQLEDDGVIQRLPSVGTFVSDRPIVQPIKADLSDVLTHLADMGRHTELRLVTFEYVQPPAEVAEALRLSSGEEVQRAERVRLVEGAPFSYLTTYVPSRIGKLYSEAELATTALQELLERTGVVPEQAEQTITATLAGPRIAQELDVEVGAALISMTRVLYAADGDGVEYLRGLYRPDRYSMRIGLVRSSDGDREIWKAKR